MKESKTEEGLFPQVGDGSGLDRDEKLHREEVQLALRNRGMPLEGLRYDVTPVGMHYLLTHFDIPYVDEKTWRLEVGGLVSRRLELDLDEVRKQPAVTLAVTMECAGNGRALLNPRPISQPWLVEAVGTARWTGTPLRGVLEDAGLKDEAIEIVFTGLDKGVQGDVVHYYQRSLSIEDATRDEVLLAYEMNGRPLEPQHGFPLRLLVPGWYGMTSVKWLTSIEAVSEPFEGYQVAEAYRYQQDRDDPGERVNLIRVRALMVPPGIPDFLTRIRLVQPGEVLLTGRAWAGRAAVSRVEVSDDSGRSWGDAQLGEPVSQYAWRPWTYRWQATPGWHELCVRAWDEHGNIQPVEQFWNYQGMGNNMSQRVRVLVQ